MDETDVKILGKLLSDAIPYVIYEFFESIQQAMYLIRITVTAHI
jgi:hypothetical protein